MRHEMMCTQGLGLARKNIPVLGFYLRERKNILLTEVLVLFVVMHMHRLAFYCREQSSESRTCPDLRFILGYSFLVAWV